MKNQWLACRSITVDWNFLGDTYKERLEELHNIMYAKRLVLGGIVWMGPLIYNRFFDMFPGMSKVNWIVEGAESLGNTIRLVFTMNNVKMKKDIKVLNFPPEDACDS